MGDDRVRPLDERGRLQALALVDLLEGYELSRIVSSPYLRCLQTVEPLARARGLDLEPREELGEDRMHLDGLRLLRELDGDDVAACVHGGAEEVVGFDGRFEKGGTIILGRGLVPEQYLPPPA